MDKQTRRILFHIRRLRIKRSNHENQYLSGRGRTLINFDTPVDPYKFR